MTKAFIARQKDRIQKAGEKFHNIPIDAVIDPFAFSPARDHPNGFQLAKMMRQRRLSQFEVLLDITYAHFSATQDMYNAYSGGICDGFQNQRTPGKIYFHIILGMKFDECHHSTTK